MAAQLLLILLIHQFSLVSLSPVGNQFSYHSITNQFSYRFDHDSRIRSRTDWEGRGSLTGEKGR